MPMIADWLREMHACGGVRPISIEVAGIDMYKAGVIESTSADEIAVWFVDTDYDYESFFVRHAYFPGANDPYKALKTTFKADRRGCVGPA